MSNGAVEGLNTNAKVMSLRTYGFRTAKNYMPNLVPLHGERAHDCFHAQIC
ncbi:MAG: transposase [Geobacteraceae bacterium]|nr:transposase [Geobacteraceae bacterium]